MPGPPPKDPRLRQRKNKVSTAATLATGAAFVAELPARGPTELPWHPLTLAWWKVVWSSPMAAEYIEADVAGIVNVMRLQDALNYGDLRQSAELRLARAPFGLTPIDRRKLQWETERGETAERKRHGAQKSTALPQPTAKNDPRAALAFPRRVK